MLSLVRSPNYNSIHQLLDQHPYLLILGLLSDVFQLHWLYYLLRSDGQKWLGHWRGQRPLSWYRLSQGWLEGLRKTSLDIGLPRRNSNLGCEHEAGFPSTSLQHSYIDVRENCSGCILARHRYWKYFMNILYIYIYIHNTSHLLPSISSCPSWLSRFVILFGDYTCVLGSSRLSMSCLAYDRHLWLWFHWLHIGMSLLDISKKCKGSTSWKGGYKSNPRDYRCIENGPACNSTHTRFIINSTRSTLNWSLI
jgi:hypothetical protein